MTWVERIGQTHRELCYRMALGSWIVTWWARRVMDKQQDWMMSPDSRGVLEEEQH